jgi:DNA-binding NtrC family response regulator
VWERENLMKRYAIFEELECPTMPARQKQRTLCGRVRRAMERILNGNDGGLKAGRRAIWELVEDNAIQEAMRASEGNKNQAARQLKISYRTLLRKADKYGIDG